MEPFEALSLCAEVAIAITGFSGVVLVFGDRIEEMRRPLDRSLFRTLFTATLIPIGIVASAFILDAMGLPRSTTWRTCSALQVLAVGTTAFLNMRSVVRMRSEVRDSADPNSLLAVRLGVGFGTGALLVLGLQLANSIWLHAFWPVLTAVWWGIAVALFAFISLLFRARPT